jgi:hypothetical protein
LATEFIISPVMNSPHSQKWSHTLEAVGPSEGIGRKLSLAEIQPLLAVTETGCINIPSGSAMEIEIYLKNLLRLQKAGLVMRLKGKAFYRPFMITALGQSLRDEYLAEMTHIS